ncbi:MAG TPA: hypothetical protein VF171_09915 [Trueperaceae bacterium]
MTVHDGSGPSGYSLGDLAVILGLPLDTATRYASTWESVTGATLPRSQDGTVRLPADIVTRLSRVRTRQWASAGETLEDSIRRLQER